MVSVHPGVVTASVSGQPCMAVSDHPAAAIGLGIELPVVASGLHAAVNDLATYRLEVATRLVIGSSFLGLVTGSSREAHRGHHRSRRGPHH